MKTIKNKKGFSLLEILLATALFAIFSVGVLGLIIQGWQMNRVATETTIAKEYASEGIEAARSVSNRSFSSLVNSGSVGVTLSGGVWTFSGTNNIFDSKYTRTIAVADVYRDGSNNIVASGGTLDPLTKKITSTVSWNFSAVRPESVVLSTYITNWRSAYSSTRKGGILVYGNGGATTDSIVYKVFDAGASTWSAAQSVADVDGSTTNKVMRSAKIYASASRNEKVLITRHYDGVSQYIYGQIFNGTSWSNVQLMSSWTGTTFLDVQNYDGTYLANGDFMIIYRDNTTTPKFRIWNGTSWGSQISTQNVGGIPNYIVAKQRPATNEVMVVTFDDQNDTNSEYFNGSTYITGNWTLHTEHSTQASVNTKRTIGFDWNKADPTKGLLTFSNNQNDRSVRYKIFTANGSGGGSWGSTVNGANQGATGTRLGVLRTITQPNGLYFLACSQNTVPEIICYRSDTAATITNPTNQTVASLTDAGIQKTFDLAYESLNATYALSVYSDNSVTPRIKKYNPATNTFDAGSTNMTNLSGVMKTSRSVSEGISDDIMIMVADANRTLYSQFWDGANHQLYTSANAWGFSTQGNNGSDPGDYFYDFAWDIY